MDRPLSALRPVELLAPAGSEEALQAAVRCGADAVYLGAGPFHARQNAQNFTLESLGGVCSYCHARGVAVHLTMNTLIKEGELPEAMRVVQAACAAGVDALIVQDWGLASLVRRCAPSMRLHASTQTSVHTPQGARALAQLGFDRVILAREMTREEIAAVCEAARQSGLEVEAFVHGAQCMSVSGQCRMSAMLGGRSANRGQCAQPCRLPFRAQGGTGYDLSLMDLSLLPYVEELSAMGVASLKIEGRMKRPEYVAAAVHAYRQALDGILPGEEEVERLKTVFSRGGLTAGYYEGRRGRAMFGRRTGEDSRAAKETYAPLHGLYRTERQSIKVELTLTREKETLLLCACDQTGKIGQARMDEDEAMSALDPNRLLRQLQKSGGTPFCINSIVLPEQPIRARLSAVNDLRRRALEALLDVRAAVRPVPFDEATWTTLTTKSYRSQVDQPMFETAGSRAGKPKSALPLWVRFGAPDQIPAELDRLSGLERIFIPIEWEDKVFLTLLDAGIPVGMDLPRGMFGCEDGIVQRMKRLHELGVETALVHNLASVRFAAGMGLLVCGGDGCNVSNANALQSLCEMGAAHLTLNPELTLSEAREIGQGGLLLYGRLPLMLTRNCPVANGGGCRYSGGDCGADRGLTDRKSITFPVVCRYGCSEVLNSRPLWMADRFGEVAFASFGLLWMTTETGEEASKVIAAYEQGASPAGDYTRGLYYRGSDQTRAASLRRMPSNG